MAMARTPAAAPLSRATASGCRARPRMLPRRLIAASAAAAPSSSSPAEPPSPSPSSSSTTTVIAPPPPLQSAASVSTAPQPPGPGDPEIFPPAGLPAEMVPEWESAVAAVQALLERAAAERAAAASDDAAASSSSSPAPRRRRAGGRAEPDAPPDLAARRHVARAFGWGSQAYWRHAVVCAAPDARRVEAALAFLCGGGGGDEQQSDGESGPLGLSAPEAADVLKSFPELLFLDAEARLGANAAQLRRQWRLKGGVLRGAVARNPRALGYDVDCQGSCVGDCHRCWARF